MSVSDSALDGRLGQNNPYNPYKIKKSKNVITIT